MEGSNRRLCQAVELNKDDVALWYRQALARLQMGDVAGYRKLCADMLGQFGSAAKPEAYWTVWTCVLAADAVADWKAPLQLAEKAVAGNPRTIARCIVTARCSIAPASTRKRSNG